MLKLISKKDYDTLIAKNTIFKEETAKLQKDVEFLVRKNAVLEEKHQSEEKELVALRQEVERLEAKIKNIMEARKNKAIEAKKKWLNAYPDEKYEDK